MTECIFSKVFGRPHNQGNTTSWRVRQLNDERTGSRDYHAFLQGEVEKMRYNFKVEESFVSKLAEANKELEDANTARVVQDAPVTTEHS